MKRLVLVSLGLVACSADEPGGDCGAGAVCGTLDASVRDVAPGTDLPTAYDATANDVVSLAIRPDTAALVVHGTTPTTLGFSAVATLRDGSTVVPGNAVWSVPPTLVGTMDSGTGLFTATGAAGGVIPVTAQIPAPGGRMLTATAMLAVRVERGFAGMGVPADAASHFTATPVTDPTHAPALDYPLDGAVMPANVAPPDVQWENGDPGDLYRVTVARPHVLVTALVLHTGMGFAYDWTVDPDGWHTVLESDPGSPVTVTVDRWVSATGTLVAGPTVTVQIARGVLSGSIYYWDLSDGRIHKLDAATSARTVAVPSPPQDPTMAGNHCIACHTVSRDGRYMSVEMWGGGREGAVFDLTASDLGSDPAPTVIAPRADLTYLFSTFNPDASQLVINQGNGLALLDRMTGMVLAGSNLPTTGSAHPEWSPDGRSLAYISNTDGTWGVDFTHGDLTVVPAAGVGAFGSPRVIHGGASTDGGTADAHPTYSPDSAWIVYQHGTNSRSGNMVGGSYQIYPGRLELIGASGGAPTALTRANGPDGLSGYWPNFSPFDAGGYFWLAYYARRDYGNAQAGTRGTHRRQIWVTAITDHPTPGADPSSTPYWLPGQTTTVENMSAYWAPAACRANGTTCRTSSECCSGECTRGADGTYACMPTMAACHPSGATCGSSADCCTPLMCAGHVCLPSPG